MDYRMPLYIQLQDIIIKKIYQGKQYPVRERWQRPMESIE